MSATGIERPIELHELTVEKLAVGPHRAVLTLPMRPALVMTPAIREALVGGMLELGIDAAGMTDAELVDSAFREGLEPSWCCPWGRGGDVLWVRERWATVLGRVVVPGHIHPVQRGELSWQPAQTMPREGARLVMRITDVGVTTALPEPALCWRLEVEVGR